MRAFPSSQFLLFAAAACGVILPAGPIKSGERQFVAKPAGSGDRSAAAPALIHAPSATCVQPRPQVASRLELTRFVIPIALARGDAASVLSRWELASREFELVQPAEKRRLVALHHPGRSAHELDLICEFRGPVEAESLARRYRWHPPTVTGAHLEVTAEPRESVERLFFRQFTLTFAGDSCRPVSIQFIDGNGEQAAPFALETNLCLEARLARAARNPDDPGPAIIPAKYTVEIETPAPAEFPGIPAGPVDDVSPGM